jgi:hypothetical protein
MSIIASPIAATCGEAECPRLAVQRPMPQGHLLYSRGLQHLNMVVAAALLKLP